MKFSIWSTICSVLFFYYFLALKENIFKVYYDSAIVRYVFNQTLKITICSDLKIFEDQCYKNRESINKLNSFDCDSLKKYPLECLTNEFRNKTAAFIIRTLKRCDQSLIFGSKIALIKYQKGLKKYEDIETNQHIVKQYAADFNFTYINNGDLCTTLVFESYIKDLEQNSSERSKMFFLFNIEQIISAIRIYVNQQQTNYTYFNFHQVSFRNMGKTFWKKRNKKFELENPDYLGGYVDGDLKTDINETLYNRTNLSTGSSKKNQTNRITRFYLPVQNVTIYTYLIHTQIFKLESPYESQCLNYSSDYVKMNKKFVRSKEECTVECYKSYVNYFKFLYTEIDEINLAEKMNKTTQCKSLCQRPNCLTDFFHLNNYKVTFNTDENEESNEFILKPNHPNSKKEEQKKLLNNKVRLHLNEYVMIIRAKPVTTPLIAIIYIFGLFNVFLGTNLVRLNAKLISRFKRFFNTKLNSSLNSSKKNKRIRSIDECFKNELKKIQKFRKFKKSNQLTKNRSNDLIRVRYVKKRKSKFKNSNSSKWSNRQIFILNMFEINKNESRPKFKNRIKFKKLTDLNQLFCFYLFLILSIFFYFEIQNQKKPDSEVNYSDFVRASVSDPISVSFCFEFVELTKQEINERFKKELNLGDDFDKLIDDIFKIPNKTKTEQYEMRKKFNENYLNKYYSEFNLEQIDKITLDLNKIVDQVYLGLKLSFNSINKTIDKTNFGEYRIHDLNSLKPLTFYFKSNKCIKFFINRTDYFFTYELEYAYVRFEFNKNVRKYFIEQDDQLPNSNSDISYGSTNFQVVRDLDRTGKCMDFESHHCKSKKDCESQCIQLNYTEKYRTITVNHPIIIDESNKLLHFDNESIANQRETKVNCKFDFESPCKKIMFKKFSNLKFYSKSVFIQLSNDLHQKRTLNRFKTIDFINSMLSIGSLIYDLNLKTIINYSIILVLLIYSKLIEFYIQKNSFQMKCLRLRVQPNPVDTSIDPLIQRNNYLTSKLNSIQKVRLLIREFLNILKFLVLFIGLTVHLYYIFYTFIFDNQLISSNYFDRPSLLDTPNFTICIGGRFRNEPNRNDEKNESTDFKINGRTGEELFQKLFPSLDQTLSSIEFRDQYLNEIKITETQIDRLEKEGHYKDLLFTSTFFLEDSKCTVFYSSTLYESLQLSLYDVMTVFKIRFRKFLKPNYSIFLPDRNKFTFRTPITIEQNQDYHLFYEKIQIKFENEFVFKKNLQNYLENYLENSKINLFPNQVLYFDHLLTEFQKQTNLTTTLIPLTKSFFKFKIDNNAFIHFYRTYFADQEDQIRIGDYDKSIFKCQLMRYDTSNQTVVQLNPLFLEQRIEYNNRFTFNEMILYVGTIVSFWLNTCYMDLVRYFKQFI